ncbi:MAG: hypothetical protein ABFS35_09585 [Bacteroidota bacterium]
MTPILETEYAQLTFEPESSVLKLVWKDNCTTETYHFVYDKIIDLVEKADVKYYIADIRKLKLIAPSDRKWLQSKIIPKLFKLGMEKIAAIVSGDVYMQRHVAHINQEIAAAKRIKQFGNLPEAMRWFKGE